MSWNSTFFYWEASIFSFMYLLEPSALLSFEWNGFTLDTFRLSGRRSLGAGAAEERVAVVPSSRGMLEKCRPNSLWRFINEKFYIRHQKDPRISFTCLVNFLNILAAYSFQWISCSEPSSNLCFRTPNTSFSSSLPLPSKSNTPNKMSILSTDTSHSFYE